MFLIRSNPILTTDSERLQAYHLFYHMENIETGLLLMVVGMTTVFIILLIVIALGKGLIALVNKYAPEETAAKKQFLRQTIRSIENSQTESVKTAAGSFQRTSARASENSSSNLLSPSETAAIVAAVSVATAGQGKVIRIEKI